MFDGWELQMRRGPAWGVRNLTTTTDDEWVNIEEFLLDYKTALKMLEWVAGQDAYEQSMERFGPLGVVALKRLCHSANFSQVDFERCFHGLVLHPAYLWVLHRFGVSCGLVPTRCHDSDFMAARGEWGCE